MIADYILLNKSDLISERISEMEKDIRKLNPYAELFSTTYARVDWLKLSAIRSSIRPAQKYSGKQSGGKPAINVWVLRTHDKVPEKILPALVNDLMENCIRIKGFLNLDKGKIASIQTSFDHSETTILESYQGPTELIVFSEKLSLVELRKIVNYYSSKVI